MPGYLTSFKGGMEVLARRMAEELGQAVRLGARVQTVQRAAAATAWRAKA